MTPKDAVKLVLKKKNSCGPASVVGSGDLPLKNVVTKTVQGIIITVNVAFLVVYVSLQVFLVRYVKNHIRRTQRCFKSTINVRKVLIKTSCLICSNVVSWTPILMTQVLIMSGAIMNPSSVLLVVMVSLPSNLFIHPFILGIPTLISLKNTPKTLLNKQDPKPKK